MAGATLRISIVVRFCAIAARLPLQERSMPGVFGVP